MISLNWVKEYIDLKNENLKDLAVKVTEAGINIEKVITNHIDNLVVGEVIECVKQPDSDHLHVCKVNVGEVIQIVCGASNVRSGIKVIVALPGAVLPGNFEIKKGKIRGVESNGMICALFELGLEEKNEENYNKGITELGSDAIVGTDALEYLGYDDTVYELDVHKHRNNDCYYHIGFAYEIAAILGKKVTLPEANYSEIEENIKDYFSLEVATKKCPYYLAKMVKDVKIKESPEFIKRRLISVGMRPINNVVDISNYVMLEYGQPMHFFDKDKLGNKILVRDASDEVITTLDGKERKLNQNDIVITDTIKPVCIAGVMGGENTEIDENTKNILIESAIFDATSIRNTANRLNLKSEASIRYGKGLNYEYTLNAINRACYLLEKYADAKILSGIVCHDEVDKTPKKVSFKTEEINKMLGIKITDEDVITELNKLDFPFVHDNDLFSVTIPNRRLDIDANINDIAEEIGRLYGYHNLVATLPRVPIRRGVYVKDVLLRKEVSKRLRSLGLNECKTYTLVSPSMSKQFVYENKENIVLPNPMSVDKSVIRTTLIPSLLNIYDYNKARNVKDIFLYEIAKTYDVNFTEDVKVAVLIKGNYIVNEWQNVKVNADFYVLKGILENLLDYLGFKNRYDLEVESISDMHPGICARVLLDRDSIGIIGRVNPMISKDDIYVLELSLTKIYDKKIKPLKYKEQSKFPSITKDLAFIVKKNISAKEITKEINHAGGRLLTNVNVFDVYTGDKVNEDEKSLAFSLTFMDSTKTLTDEEVMSVFDKIIAGVTSKFNAVLRDK